MRGRLPTADGVLDTNGWEGVGLAGAFCGVFCVVPGFWLLFAVFLDCDDGFNVITSPQLHKTVYNSSNTVQIDKSGKVPAVH